ncbi:3-hydroxyacyl-ACP dehydratase FabZ family protein [Patiriisocius sp. Uisw_017]|jgi:3-hydroxyacyl-[acyl-carrier-protein] dehydratase|uniref:3-hydroxyacyl-ACP dehydratase FabZ family protein n=1 Tax=Patiriisocius sp. Uisw_017 TaxID=3230968 RepID=UPI0039EA25E3
MNYKEIITRLPYSKPFLFVDALESVSENGVVGRYTFRAESDFYKGHFKENPITPGVLLTECMAQIGVVCLGIFLTATSQAKKVALSNTSIDFYKPVLPDETVTVHSEKIYFRFGKLKCKVRMLNAKDEVVALGEISGMVI